ncbi:single-stranded DNA-binding protein [Peribacillus acanthi]|uniref:single-stranded DNA-binding protein n=1 Tax=Peribacillus acanthi TaxID=2171554 RepID=UPI000D3E16A3|nr:single-stranded DNA-binding protein [Peribacillus acanthi]
MNSVQIIGNISTDIDLKAIPSGKFVAKFNVAINNPFNREKVSFLPVEVWGKVAENTSNFCSKGSKIGVVGHLEVEQWEKEGQKQYKTKIIASSIEFLTPKSQNESRNTQGNTNTQETEIRTAGGRNSSQYNRVDDPFKNSGQPLDISDDDLPFQ